MLNVCATAATSIDRLASTIRITRSAGAVGPSSPLHSDDPETIAMPRPPTCPRLPVAHFLRRMKSCLLNAIIPSGATCGVAVSQGGTLPFSSHPSYCRVIKASDRRRTSVDNFSILRGQLCRNTAIRTGVLRKSVPALARTASIRRSARFSNTATELTVFIAGSNSSSVKSSSAIAPATGTSGAA